MLITMETAGIFFSFIGYRLPERVKSVGLAYILII